MKVFDKLSTSNQRMLEYARELIDGCEFKLGDPVRLKIGNSPDMVISKISVNTKEDYQSKISTMLLEIECIYFNKSKQEFVRNMLSSFVLKKIEDDK